MISRAPESCCARWSRAVLVKGGHLTGESVTDVLVDEAGVHRFSGSRIESSSTHGTGCTLASAIRNGLGTGLSLQEAILRARAFVRHAMRTGLPFGKGTGPLIICTASPLPKFSVMARRDRATQPPRVGAASSICSHWMARVAGHDTERGETSLPRHEGSRTNIVSSRSGLVESSATGAPINSSTRLIYLIAVAGSCPGARTARRSAPPFQFS